MARWRDSELCYNKYTVDTNLDTGKCCNRDGPRPRASNVMQHAKGAKLHSAINKIDKGNNVENCAEYTDQRH